MVEDLNSLLWEVAEGKISNVDGRTAFIAARKGDETAKKVVQQFVGYLSEGIADFVNILRPEAIVIGGGVGVPPMYKLAKSLIAEGKKVTAILGFNTAGEIFAQEEFKKIGCDVIVTTVDGSYGVKGFVTNAMDFDYTYTFCCGPEPMLKAVYNTSRTSGQYSFEERMGCGFGACMGCTCKTKYGNKRICKDGPVLVKEEIIW